LERLPADINRLVVPRGYAALDRLLRPRRHDGNEIDFGEKWTEKMTRDWIRRFEKTVP
jgi:hypothetical protein